MARYWFHAYTPETWTDARSKGFKEEVYFYKPKSKNIMPGDILICYLAGAREGYCTFWGLLKVDGEIHESGGRFLASQQPMLMLDDPRTGPRYNDPEIWEVIRSELKIKNFQAWGTFVQSEPSPLPEDLSKIIEEKLRARAP